MRTAERVAKAWIDEQASTLIHKMWSLRPLIAGNVSVLHGNGPYLQPDLSALPVCRISKEVMLPPGFVVATGTVAFKSHAIPDHYFLQDRQSKLVLDFTVGQVTQMHMSSTSALTALEAAGAPLYIYDRRDGLYALVATPNKAKQAGILYTNIQHL